MYTFVIGNAPSSRRFLDIKMHPSIGCNYAVRDWQLDHVVCADRLAVHAVRQLSTTPGTQYWCKASPLETPDGWKDLEFPGLDSGSAALKLAGMLYPDNPIIAIGFDGVLGLDNSNAYTYDFRPVSNPEKIRHRHTQAVLQVVKNLPPVKFASHQLHNQLETIDYDHALKIAVTQSRSLHQTSDQA